jgi:hypothetical protein
MEYKQGSVFFFTTAPKEYDWGWTKQMVAVSGFTDNRGRDFRMVEVADEYHAGMQKGRYHSGMYPCFTPEEFDASNETEVKA